MSGPCVEECCDQRLCVKLFNMATLLVTEGAVDNEEVVLAQQNEDIQLYFLIEAVHDSRPVNWFVEWFAPFFAKLAQVAQVTNMFVPLGRLTRSGEHGP